MRNIVMCKKVIYYSTNCYLILSCFVPQRCQLLIIELLCNNEGTDNFTTA